MTIAPVEAEETKPWLYAFLILVIVSACMLTLRLLDAQFLPTEFEVTLVYLPTALAGIITLYLNMRPRPNCERS